VIKNAFQNLVACKFSHFSARKSHKTLKCQSERSAPGSIISYLQHMKQSAGILLYQATPELVFFLAHPGGPFWKNKDAGAWSIPKGEFTADEDPLQAAIREFQEETGYKPEGDFMPLSPVKLKSGKTIHAWALEQYVDPAVIVSNTFEMEWPPKSAKLQSFPEIDRAGWFTVAEALEKINEGQRGLILEVTERFRKSAR
jgi:predicted NUDIX family NTP pyrophosphohydrolase